MCNQWLGGNRVPDEKLLFTLCIHVLQVVSTTFYSCQRRECGSAEITTVSRWLQHLRRGCSCGHSRRCESSPAKRLLCHRTSDCPTELFPSQPQKKLLPGPLRPPHSPAGDTPPEHRGDPRHHHTQFPTKSVSKSPHGPHKDTGHLPVSGILLEKNPNKTIMVILIQSIRFNYC